MTTYLKSGFSLYSPTKYQTTVISEAGFQRLRALENGQVYWFDYEGVASFGWALSFLEQFQLIAEEIRTKL